MRTTVINIPSQRAGGAHATCEQHRAFNKVTMLEEGLRENNQAIRQERNADMIVLPVKYDGF